MPLTLVAPAGVRLSIQPPAPGIRPSAMAFRTTSIRLIRTECVRSGESWFLSFSAFLGFALPFWEGCSLLTMQQHAKALALSL